MKTIVVFRAHRPRKRTRLRSTCCHLHVHCAPRRFLPRAFKNWSRRASWACLGRICCSAERRKRRVKTVRLRTDRQPGSQYEKEKKCAHQEEGGRRAEKAPWYNVARHTARKKKAQKREKERRRKGKREKRIRKRMREQTGTRKADQRETERSKSCPCLIIAKQLLKYCPCFRETERSKKENTKEKREEKRREEKRR